MADSGPGDGDRKRLYLLIPVSSVVTSVWLLCAVRAVVTGDVTAFTVASVPFGGLCGYVFGISLPWGGGKP